MQERCASAWYCIRCVLNLYAYTRQWVFFWGGGLNFGAVPKTAAKTYSWCASGVPLTRWHLCQVVAICQGSGMRGQTGGCLFLPDGASGAMQGPLGHKPLRNSESTIISDSLWNFIIWNPMVSWEYRPRQSFFGIFWCLHNSPSNIAPSQSLFQSSSSFSSTHGPCWRWNCWL